MILRDLGVLHLDNKVTRPRRSDDETEVMILKEAGIMCVDLDDCEANSSKENVKEKRGRISEAMIRTISSKDAEILQSAGVTWDDKTCVEFFGTSGESTVTFLKKGWSSTGEECRECRMPIICKSKGVPECVKCGVVGGEVIKRDTTMMTSITASLQKSVSGMEDSTAVNSIYAERELTRLLKKGWSSTGKECHACGMPIICKSKGSLHECVVCGVVGEEDDCNSDAEDAVSESPRVIEVMTTNLQKSSSDMKEPECETHQANKDEMDEAFNEALGSRLFEGWTLSSKNCNYCKSPLVTEFEGAPTVCLRCE